MPRTLVELATVYRAGATTRALGLEEGVTKTIIVKRLRRAGVELRPSTRRRQDQPATTTVLTAYDAGRSQTEIAKATGLSQWRVCEILKHEGVDGRTRADGIRLRKNKHVVVTEALLALMDGLLLGDASVTAGKRSECRLVVGQSLDHLGWLESLQPDLVRFGLVSTIDERPASHDTIDGKSFVRQPRRILRSRHYVELRVQRQRWYPDGVKIVPKDVRLTPRALAEWYWGDGTTRRLRRQRAEMRFCTNGFTWGDVEFLRDRVSALYGWRPRIDKSNLKQPMLTLGCRADVEDLAHMITPFVPECFRYKLP